jgi:hypothetical protein
MKLSLNIKQITGKGKETQMFKAEIELQARDITIYPDKQAGHESSM